MFKGFLKKFLGFDFNIIQSGKRKFGERFLLGKEEIFY